MTERQAHDHVCGECGTIYPCPKPLECPCETAEQRIGLCSQCEPPEGVEVFNRSEDGFEAIIKPLPRSRIRVQ